MFERIRIIKWLLIFFLILSFFISCNGGEMEKTKIHYNALKDVPVSAWEKLAQKKIYFGHQSVGYNILDGVKELMKEHTEIKLNIVETADKADSIKGGIFAHSRVGSNCDPKSKIDNFKKLMNEALGENTDIAFFKFCYIDFNPGTDVEKIFAEYKDAILKLKKEYPATEFIHVTVPLVKIQTGPKAWIKKIIGRSIDGTSDNAARCKFNELLKKEYEGTDPIFDLAKAESTYPDGKRESFINQDGNTCYALIPAYTDDGGHLNSTGQKVAASRLLLILTEKL